MQESGEVQESGERSGLYFCGFHVTATGMLRQIAHEAKHIAAQINQTRKANPAKQRVRRYTLLFPLS